MIVKKVRESKVVWGFRYRYKDKGKWVKKETYNRKWLKRDAEQAEIDFITSLEQPRYDLSFVEIYDMYLNTKKDKMKLRSFNNLKGVCDAHILPNFKDYRLSDIKSNDIEQWQSELLKKTYTVKDVKHLYANRQLEKVQINFKAMMNYAYDRELIDRNPFRSISFVKRRKEATAKDEKRFITLEEFNRIMYAIEVQQADTDDEVVAKAQDLVIFSVLFWCGLRKGELMALDVSDYDLIKKELHIYKNWDYTNKIITTPKTEKSVRIVAVPDVVDQHIIKLIALYRKYYDYNPDAALISYYRRIPSSTLTRKKDHYCELAGLQGIKLHDFRHSHVSLLINSGLQPFEIAKRLGHTVEMVNEVYGHLYPSKQKEMVEMMNNIT